MARSHLREVAGSFGDWMDYAEPWVRRIDPIRWRIPDHRSDHIVRGVVDLRDQLEPILTHTVVFDIPKGYIYSAMAFSVLVETLNLLAKGRRDKKKGKSAEPVQLKQNVVGMNVEVGGGEE